MVRECKSCQRIWNNLPTTVLHPWSWPEGPWRWIHVDFAGPFFGPMYLLVLMTIESVWKFSHYYNYHWNLFPSYGLPEQLVSDNCPQFTSHKFELCMKANGIKYIKTSPYHPDSNGEAKHFVKTFKQAMQASEGDPGSLSVTLVWGNNTTGLISTVCTCAWYSGNSG